LKRHINNFDFLRFLFALFVVISHSYALSGIPEKDNWLCVLTGNQLNFSQLGLNGFFVISGYFIFESLQRSKNLLDYYKKRFLRLFPALFMVLLLSVLMIPFVYSGTRPLLQNTSFWTYLPFNLSLYGFQGVVEGVFDTNKYHAINGSLWTIRYEFSLYFALSLLLLVKGYKKLTMSLLVLVFALFYICYNFYLSRLGGASLFNLVGVHVLNLGTFFIGGSVLASLDFKNWNYRNQIGITTLLLLTLAVSFGYYDILKHVLFSICILAIGFFPLPVWSDFGKFGDSSYGIYIYSFPIQQLLVYFGIKTIDVLLFFSILISIGFGYASWHGIEKKALLLKNDYKGLKFKK
jgi:peptidoglycan/LPS O-acetylase OafA/YrhL